MENKRLVAAIASGLLCALSVFAFTQSVQASADAQRAEALERFGGEQIEVCVATRDIAAGETPSASCVTSRMWVSDLLPQDPVLSLNEATSHSLTSPVFHGEVLTKRHFSSTGASLEVPAGLCALSVPAEEVKAVGGAVASGMKVDVYLSGSSGITLLAHDVLVLATSVGDGDASSNTKISWLTLAVEPKSVHEFIAAADKGNLYFVLQGEKLKEEVDDDQDPAVR